MTDFARLSLNQPLDIHDAEVVNAAIEAIKESKKINISLLQRQLKIGFHQAGEIIQLLQRKCSEQQDAKSK